MENSFLLRPPSWLAISSESLPSPYPRKTKNMSSKRTYEDRRNFSEKEKEEEGEKDCRVERTAFR